MTYSTLSPSGLRYSSDHATWNVDVLIYNLTRLNDTLLKLSALADVDVSGLSDGNVLSYSTSTSKWTPDVGPESGRWLSTTTTTTSSSSTSTST